jgi:hypothetical protein
LSDSGEPAKSFDIDIYPQYKNQVLN